MQSLVNLTPAGRWMASLLAIPLLICTLIPATARDDDEEIRGVITVDAAGGTVTVAGTVLVVDSETELEADHNEVTLQALGELVAANPGVTAEAEYRLETGVKVARKVEVELEDEDEGEDQELQGELTANAGDGTVTVGGVVLAVDANTDIEAGDAPATFAELVDYLAANPGTRGEARYRLDGENRIATKIETKGDREDDGDEDDEDEEELVGVITADTGANTVSIGTVTFQTASGTEFKLNRRHVSFSVFAAYLAQHPDTLGKVEYRVLNELLVAREVKAIGAAGAPGSVAEAESTGVIQSLNARTGALELLTDSQVSLNLKLEPGTEIEVDNANVTLAELAGLLAPDLEVRARVHYDPTTFRVRELSATIPVTQQQAQVTSANARSGAVVLRVPNPSRPGRFLSVRYVALKGGTVLRNGSVVRLVEVKRGLTITISSFTSRRRKIAPEITINP